MPADDNVTALHAAGAQWNAGNLEGYLTLYDPEAVLYGYSGVEPGLAGIRRFYQAFRAAFPGCHLVLEDVFASGEKVACRFLLEGEHAVRSRASRLRAPRLVSLALRSLSFKMADVFADGAIRTPLGCYNNSGLFHHGRSTRPQNKELKLTKEAPSRK